MNMHIESAACLSVCLRYLTYLARHTLRMRNEGV